MTQAALVAAVKFTEHELPIPAFLYGVLGAIVFLFLGIILWSYKDVAARHADPHDPDAPQHMTSTGSETHGGGHAGSHH